MNKARRHKAKLRRKIKKHIHYSPYDDSYHYPVTITCPECGDSFGCLASSDTLPRMLPPCYESMKCNECLVKEHGECSVENCGCHASKEGLCLKHYLFAKRKAKEKTNAGR